MHTTSALLSQGIALHQAGKLASAETYYLQVLKANPRDPNANHFLGVLRGQQGAASESLKLIEKAVRLAPGVPMFVMNYALALKGVGRSRQALAALDEVLAKTPANTAAWINRGLVQIDLGLAEESIASYDRALAIDPRIVAAWINRGNALRGLDRPTEAVESYDRALELAPNAEAHCERGNALVELHRLGEALDSYTNAIHHNPGYLEAYSNRAIALLLLNDAAAAVASCDGAIARKPDYAEAHYNRGNALVALERLGEALASYDKALAVRPGYADCHYSRGNVLRRLNRPRDSLAAYHNAHAAGAKPVLSGQLTSAQLSAALQVCEWRRSGELATELQARASDPQPLAAPFALLACCDDPAVHLACASSTMRGLTRTTQPFWRTRTGGVKLRLGYVSADIRAHAIATLIAELIERHDRNRFEVIAISYGPDDGSAMRRRLVEAFDAVHDVRTTSDHETARLISKLGIDIAIDLTGLTQHARPQIFAHRPAPVQVSYLGYPGTLGADFIDYVLADATVLPFAEQPHWREKIVHLPHCYQVNDSKREISPSTPSRQACGLPPEGFVFCCFNNVNKITPTVFDVWMRLIANKPGSVLWLLGDNEDAVANLRREAQARGVDPGRLVFASRCAAQQHLARQRHADLFLDTLPYNAHTTASDALWVGLPLLTVTGRSFASRVAASLLKTVGLSELVASNLAEYEAIARRLVADPAELARLREKLEVNKNTSPLFSGETFASHIEAAYTQMWQLHEAGECPRSFSVNPVSS